MPAAGSDVGQPQWRARQTGPLAPHTQSNRHSSGPANEQLTSSGQLHVAPSVVGHALAGHDGPAGVVQFHA